MGLSEIINYAEPAAVDLLAYAGAYAAKLGLYVCLKPSWKNKTFNKIALLSPPLFDVVLTASYAFKTPQKEW